MCGIVGYIGSKNVKKILLDGLRELEYRGYDSAGIAIMQDKNLYIFKAVGKLDNLKEKTKQFEPEGFGIGIGHTRWATHGKPTELNAHPHMGEYSYVVHNGIIENFKEIKEELKNRNFVSQTDTETIVHLFEENLKKSENPKEAFRKTIKRLQGAYAVLLITKAEPQKIFFAKKGSPLIIGKNGNEIYFASSDAPLIGNAKEVHYLEDNEWGVAEARKIELFQDDTRLSPSFQKLTINKEYAQKGGFRFFMEKEIYEQSDVITETMMGRIHDEGIHFDEIDDDFLQNISNITICACGTSYHAGLSGSYLIEQLAKIPVRTEIASEFRYKNPILQKNTLFIVVSQSGETADTLEALKMAKNAGLKTVAICNVDNSSIVRLADRSILTRAGIEKGVASTKAFTTQLMVLWMLSVYLAQQKSTLTKNEIEQEIHAMSTTPKALKVRQEMHERIKRLSKRYLHGHGFFYIGRDIFYPLALEGALKLKEISYLHAEGYPAGEMKHGPIALADPELFTIALMPKNRLYEKTKSNVEELSARDSTICAISFQEFDLADDFIKINEWNHFMLEYYEMVVVLQLLAMEIAIRLGNDVDMPRNLAKSVTVE
ncbi:MULTISPECIES: glutamine--fructose-6-phosphate transaminase (isomerizing) [unclassified Nitratiruptor]|uniref:glutamine--fructose-6-phosphate transaminase (isomerizing) n=1 Tax=unclassified Nitratiruptor TaxID=2624044 RepID=UPI001936DA62|nr:MULTISPECIES: glutamine--fructose-6-phosphate transaminase (isomerizing) [unclassified Nitratiruptor]BCD59947.1 glutamine---fructose-6-phosphate transaminase (isomerizing) [Nitratiruptor sp. YY08-10]BCD63870.1 glutamine---fructose-6-phosphate transaminase (isomerizing) [Nitratiruptor sp. YY08-14]